MNFEKQGSCDNESSGQNPRKDAKHKKHMERINWSWRIEAGGKCTIAQARLLLQINTILSNPSPRGDKFKGVQAHARGHNFQIQ